jgi:branched-chain amino acid transport system permease protein
LGDLVEQLVHGLTLGSLYAMVATGLALMFGVVRLVNFAHGEFYMLGGYAFWYAYGELGLPYPVAGLAAAAAMGAFGLAYERTVIRTILARTWHVQLIATLATSITLTNLAILVFGTQPKEVPTTLSSRSSTSAACAWGSGRSCSSRQWCLAGLQWFVMRQARAAMRAVSQNRGVRGGGRGRAAGGPGRSGLGRPRRGGRAGRRSSHLLTRPAHLKAFAAVIVGAGFVKGAIAALPLSGVAESRRRSSPTQPKDATRSWSWWRCCW